MKIKILYKGMIDNLNLAEADEEKFLNYYNNEYISDNKDILTYYFKYYVPFSGDRIKKYSLQLYTNLRENLKKYHQLMNFTVPQDLVERFFYDMDISYNLFENITINLFCGLDTCEAFPILSYTNPSINIAVEKFLLDQEPYIRMGVTMGHELSHIVRFFYGLVDINHTLGDMLIEEGLACLASRKFLNSKEDEEKYILPKNINSKNIDYNKLLNIYIKNIHSTDSNLILKLMNLGCAKGNIEPGTGYVIGMRLLTDYMKTKNIQLSDIYSTKSDKIVKDILKSR